MTTATLTLDQFLALPETNPASEYVCGQVQQKPMPTYEHAYLQFLLAKLLGNFLDQSPVAFAGTEWRCVFGPADQERTFVPDLMLIRRERLPSGTRPRGAYHGAPDLAIEILSPDQPALAFAIKLRFYLNHGVRLVWVVDPATATITVLTPDTDERILTVDDTLDGGDVLPGFMLPVAELFAQLEA